jgi:hypothetical protein
MNTFHESQEMYRFMRENRYAMYSKPRRYFNRDGQNGSAFKFLFLVEAIVFFLMVLSATATFAQQAEENPLLTSTASEQASSIHNYATIYNSGKVFINWTAKNEPADCIYVIERSADALEYEPVGIKEGIGTEIELFYSYVDQTPPNGFAYYRVKKITKEGTQMYSAVNTVINQGSSYDVKSNYARKNVNDDEKK